MNILICGIGGRMGHEVARLALDGYQGAAPACGVGKENVSQKKIKRN